MKLDPPSLEVKEKLGSASLSGSGGEAVIVVGPPQHAEVSDAELLDHALAPLDDGHRLLHGGVQVEVVDLRTRVGRGAQAVRVGVHQRDLTAARGVRPVHPGDDEGRGRDVPPYPQAGADALHQRGLAGAQRAGQHDQIAGAQQAT